MFFESIASQLPLFFSQGKEIPMCTRKPTRKSAYQESPEPGTKIWIQRPGMREPDEVTFKREIIEHYSDGSFGSVYLWVEGKTLHRANRALFDSWIVPMPVANRERTVSYKQVLDWSPCDDGLLTAARVLLAKDGNINTQHSVLGLYREGLITMVDALWLAKRLGMNEPTSGGRVYSFSYVGHWLSSGGHKLVQCPECSQYFDQATHKSCPCRLL